jgi:ribonuclease G
VRTIAIEKEADAYKIALLEDGQLVELIVDQTDNGQRAGSIYKGRIVNVLPGMQAAFVDIGQGKNAYLYVTDLLPAHLEKQPKIKPSIDELVRVGEERIVQIAKEPTGSKGARVTTHFALPGRYLVYMPGADYVAVSRKLESDEERMRLKQWAENMRRPGEGLIMRTLAKGRSGEELRLDLENLREIWLRIRTAAEEAEAPAEIYRDLDILERSVRDFFSQDVAKVWTADAQTADRLKRYAVQWLPDLTDKIEVVSGEERLFARLGLEAEIKRAFARKVWLKNGGYLVIDHTEALTVIDVNTGKFTGKKNLEETVFQTNLEAAREIGRLIRLRDIGGIIIVDFIDMNQDQHRHEVVQVLQETLKKDRTKTVVVGWTQLGLLEMTRKKVREHAWFHRDCSKIE